MEESHNLSHLLKTIFSETFYGTTSCCKASWFFSMASYLVFRDWRASSFLLRAFSKVFLRERLEALKNSGEGIGKNGGGDGIDDDMAAGMKNKTSPS